MKESNRLLSVIVTAHREGEIAGRTVRAIARATKKLKEIGFNYQFLVNIDNGDEITINYFKQNISALGGKIYYTKFGDPSLARNSIIKKAKGKYIAVIDADDIISSNWLAKGLKRILAEPFLAVVHPETEVRFSEKELKSIVVRTEYKNSWYETLALIEGNRWCSVIIGRKEVFKKNQYPRNGKGFGFEDYSFNCKIVNSGIRHLIVPDTSVFCLQKEESISVKSHKNYDILPYNKLLSLKRLQRQMKILGLPDSKLKETKKGLPKFVETEMKKIIENESSMKNISKELSKVSVGRNDEGRDIIVGEAFCRMFSEINLRFLPKRLIFTDDLGEIGEHMGRRDLIVVTDSKRDVLAAGRMINFGQSFGGAPKEIQQEMLTRLIVQSRVKKIVANDFVRDWLDKHRVFLRENNIGFNLK